MHGKSTSGRRLRVARFQQGFLCSDGYPARAWFGDRQEPPLPLPAPSARGPAPNLLKRSSEWPSASPTSRTSGSGPCSMRASQLSTVTKSACTGDDTLQAQRTPQREHEPRPLPAIQNYDWESTQPRRGSARPRRGSGGAVGHGGVRDQAGTSAHAASCWCGLAVPWRHRSCVRGPHRRPRATP